MAVTSCSEMLPRVPVIVILGATGSGKSKLAIEIARKYGGEILSADSMQVYQGLDIITNKVTAEEMTLARHHMIDMVNPLHNYTVVDYRNQALGIMDSLLAEKKLPVIVGGTNYYIESLLWKVLVDPQPTSSSSTVETSTEPLSIAVPSATERSSSTLNPVDKDLSSISGKPVSRDESFVSELKNGGKIEETVSCGNRAEVSLPTEYCANAELNEVCAVSNDASAEVNIVSAEVNVASAVVTIASAEVIVASAEVKTTSVVNDACDGERPTKRVKRGCSDEESATSEELHRRLEAVDPEMADMLHPNDRRKIYRSLQVLATQGRTHTEILREQRDSLGGSALGGALRYPHSCILWLQCDQEVLDRRLDARVDAMLDAGLVQELLDFHAHYNAQRLRTQLAVDYTTGIFQSIGFKEFHDYLILSECDRASETGQRLLSAGVVALKTVTRRYARKQVKWVVNRFLRRPDRQVPPVFALDASDPSLWDSAVFEPAAKIVGSLMGDSALDIDPLPVGQPLDNERRSHRCEVCDRIFVGTLQWNAHRASKKHQKMVNRMKRLGQMGAGGDEVKTTV